MNSCLTAVLDGVCRGSQEQASGSRSTAQALERRVGRALCPVLAGKFFPYKMGKASLPLGGGHGHLDTMVLHA